MSLQDLDAGAPIGEEEVPSDDTRCWRRRRFSAEGSFYIHKSKIGLLMGKSGVTIQQLSLRCGVFMKVEKCGRKNKNRFECQILRIRGPSYEKVLRCSELANELIMNTIRAIEDSRNYLWRRSWGWPCPERRLKSRPASRWRLAGNDFQLVEAYSTQATISKEQIDNDWEVNKAPLPRRIVAHTWSDMRIQSVS